LIPLILVFLLSCKGQQNKHCSQQIKVTKDADVTIYIPNKVYANDESCVNLFFKNDDYKMIAAYIDCNSDSIKLDSSDRIIGCGQKLYKTEDTIKVCLTPTHTGLYKFHEITMVYKDTLGTYYVSDTTFSLYVR
jgi:hypothetical protein